MRVAKDELSYISREQNMQTFANCGEPYYCSPKSCCPLFLGTWGDCTLLKISHDHVISFS